MLVWGGNSASIPGQRYDPAADAWSDMSAVDAPPGRSGMSAVWTGTFMVIWGGAGTSTGLNTGGRYCACPNGTCACSNGTFYADDDGDGFGDPADSVVACNQPAGYVPVGGDCNDADGSNWSVPSEVGDLAFDDNDSIFWSAPAAPGATIPGYDLLRSSSAQDFVTGAECIVTSGATLGGIDPDAPAPGGIFYYLVRAVDGCPGGGEGSLGARSDGTPRTGRSCP
jgi:hypothetical protein